MFRRFGSWLALYALLLQAFWPVAAAAVMASGPGGFPIQICTPQGLVEISDGVLVPSGQTVPYGQTVPSGQSLPSGAPQVHHCLFCNLGAHASGVLGFGVNLPQPGRLLAASLVAHAAPAVVSFSVSVSHPRGPPSLSS